MTHMPKKLSALPKYLGFSNLWVATGEKQVQERLKQLPLSKNKTELTHFLLARCPIKTHYIEEILDYRPKTVELLGCTGITSDILDMIAKCDSVNTLDMDESVVAPESLAKLKPSKVVKLSLRSCNLTNEHLKEIAKLDILELIAADNKNLDERSLAILARPPGRLKMKVWTDGWSVPKFTGKDIARFNHKLGIFVTTKPFRVTSEWVGQLEDSQDGQLQDQKEGREEVQQEGHVAD